MLLQPAGFRRGGKRRFAKDGQYYCGKTRRQSSSAEGYDVRGLPALEVPTGYPSACPGRSKASRPCPCVGSKKLPEMG